MSNYQCFTSLRRDNPPGRIHALLPGALLHVGVSKTGLQTRRSKITRPSGQSSICILLAAFARVMGGTSIITATVAAAKASRIRTSSLVCPGLRSRSYCAHYHLGQRPGSGRSFLQVTIGSCCSKPFRISSRTLAKGHSGT